MEIQEAIDAKLVDLGRRSLELLQEIQELKAQRNTHALISKLPDEILLEFFMVLMARFPVETWYQVAQVCHRWRNVAVGAPMLWTKPDTAKHKLTMLMLERSKEADLTIRLDSSTSSTETAQAVLDCIGRIESLEVNQDDEGHENSDDWEEVQRDPRLLQVLLKGLMEDTSRLTSLRIFCYSERGRYSSQATRRLLHPLGQLTDLQLMSVCFDWTVFPLNNLTHLYFEDVSLQASVSVQKLVNTLREMPLLESLALPFSREVLSRYTPSATTEAMVILPFLRLLYLTGSHPDHICYFLTHTAFPRLRRLELEIKDPHGYDNFVNDHYSTFISAIASSVTNGNFGTFEGLSIRPYSFRFFMFGAGHESPHLIRGFEYPPESPHILLHVPGPRRADEAKLRLSTQMPLDMFELCRSNISRLLHIDVLDFLTEEEFMHLFGGPRCSHLQKITIDNHFRSMPKLTNVLAVPPHPAWEPPAIPFPDMKSIRSTWGDFTTSSGSSDLDAFCECLMSRRRAGYPLHELELWHCSVNPTQLARLKRAVVELKYASHTL